MVEAVVANLVATAILIVAGWITLALLFLGPRRALADFFGVRPSKPKLLIFVSRLQIPESGFPGHQPIGKGFDHPAIIRLEYIGATLFADLFRSTMLARIPRRLRHLVGDRFSGVVDVDLKIDIAPTGAPPIPTDSTLILLGGAVYNALTEHYLNQPQSWFQIPIKTVEDTRSLEYKKGGLVGVHVARQDDNEYGIVQRLYDEANRNTVFICAGLGSSATYGCARYLAENWAELAKRVGDKKDLAVCLVFPDQDWDVADPEQVARPIEVYASWRDI